MPEHLQTEGEFADHMIRRILVAYPNQAPKIFADEFIGKEAWELWRKEFAEMEKRFGRQRLESSLTRWIRGNEYMPEVSQIRDGIEPDFNATRFDANCECRGTGWRSVPVAGKKLPQMAKCDCWKRKAKSA